MKAGGHTSRLKTLKMLAVLLNSFLLMLMVEYWEFAETLCALEAKAQQNASIYYVSYPSIKQYEDSSNKTTVVFQLPLAPKPFADV